MAKHQDTLSATLKTAMEAEFGAGTFSEEASEEIKLGAGVIVYSGYGLERLSYQQDVATYEFLVLFKKSVGNDSDAARKSVIDSFEDLRASFRVDPTLTDTIKDTRVTSILAQSVSEQDAVLGAMTVEYEVYL
jgi:hypothetical protein